MNSVYNNFTHPILIWHDQFGRQTLPWKQPCEAYRIWISEIMLQQTQVKTVIPYFLKFIQFFPNLETLASAKEDEVLSLWSGLGYYSRCRNLYKTAKIIQNEYEGIFPETLDTWVSLPGIGPSTAAAIVSQAFNKPTAILDGNVKRVLSRYFMIEGYTNKTTQQLWELAQHCQSHERPADYTQAIMDLGATCCRARNPLCGECPLTTHCLARINNQIANYPSRKPKKKLPEKYKQFLLIHTHDRSIYLEKRPPQGIWGSLWCTPAIETESHPAEYLETHYDFQVESIEPLLNIKHTFTHFRLHITGLAIQLSHIKPPVSKPNCGWFSQTETIKLGLPKPISDMINQYFTKS